MKYKVINKGYLSNVWLDICAAEYIKGNINLDGVTDHFVKLMSLSVEASLKAIHSIKEEFE